MPGDHAVLTLRQKLWACPYRLVHWQTVIAAERLVYFPDPLPPSVLRIRSLITLGTPRPGASSKLVSFVNWWPVRVDGFQCNCMPINQIRPYHKTGSALTTQSYFMGRDFWKAIPLFRPCAQPTDILLISETPGARW